MPQETNPVAQPYVTVTIPDSETLNARLTETLIAMSRSVPDAVSNMASGQSYFVNKWLSKSDLHLNLDPDIQSLVKFAEEAANREFQPAGSDKLSVTSMWAVVGEPGLKGERHEHEGKVSAAFYVAAGSSGPEDGGELQFFESLGSRFLRRVRSRLGLSPKEPRPSHVVAPRSGLLVLFPSALTHSVSRYEGTDPRIVISINLS